MAEAPEAFFNYEKDMDAEQSPIVDRMNKNYTLYVTNIPPELDENAIRNLFGEHGKIVDLILRSNKGWAYITYGSYREAELVMRNMIEFNNKTLLGLQITLLRKPKSSKKEDDAVSFAENSNEIHEQQNQRLAYTATESLPVCNDSIYTQKITRGNPLNALRKHNLVPQETQTANSRSVLSNDQDEDLSPFFDANRLWTRGVVTVTRDGTKRVSLGRGYTLYEFPDEDINLEGHIDKVYERRSAGLYEYSEDKLSSALKSCVLCNVRTIHRCEKCYTYYCSKACQVKDWPRHQANCDRIPALIKDKVNDISSLCIKDDNQTQIPQSSASNKTATQQTSTIGNAKLRRPNIPNMQAGNFSNTVNVNTDKNNAGCSNNNGNNQNRYSLLHINVNESQPRQENQLTNGTRDSSQNWSPKHLDETTDQSKKNNTSLSPKNQHNKCSYQPNKTANTKIPNKGNFDNDNNMRGRNQFHQKNEHQNDEKSALYDNRGTVKQENAFTVSRNGQYLSQTKFTNVEITVQLGNNEYWICKDEDIPARADLMNKLEHLAVKSRNLKPIVGNVYGVLYKNTWRRAMVKSFNPIKVHYIDYGNEEILDKNVIFKDIRDLLKISNFAQKIRLTPVVNRPYKNLLCNDKISVRMLSVDADNTMVVEMQETSEDLLHATESTAQSNKNITMKELVSPRNLQISVNTSKKSESQENLQVSVNTNNKTPKLCNILYKFINGEQSSELEQSGFIELHEQSEKNVYNATLCASSYLTELQTIYEDMQIDCEKMKVINYKPRADELICGLEKDGGKGTRWHRGYIYIPYSTSPSNIYMCTLDVPKFTKIEKIVQCPEEYQNILTFGVTCIVEKSTEFQLEGEVFQIKIINKQAQEMKVKLLPEEKSCIKEDIPAVIKLWSYVTPVRSELTSGTKVCITHPYNHYVAFVRSMDDEDESYFLDIMSRVRNCAKTAPFLTKPPNINQIVIAPFIDNNSYRATVIKLLEDDNVLVQYNDFGNIYKLKRQKLQVIPDDLAKERSCLIKILLKDVPRDVTITEEARVYLQNLADTETPLTYIRSSSSEDVYLVTATGERINDKIKELLSKPNNEKKYMLRDIGIAELGSAGSTVNAMVMHIEKPGVSYMLIPSDSALLAQFDALSVPMTEYCNKTKYYIPKNNELCLALYEKEWYRAVCINSKKTQVASEIFFIDYGNSEIVNHHNIREMHKDFMHPPAMVTKCEVINLAPVDSTGHPSTVVQNKLAELMDVYKVVQIKIVEITDNVMKIELPEIRAILIKNGLV